MNLFERAVRSCFRKPVKSILLLLVVCIISILFLSGMASRSANIAVNDSTRQAIGAGFLLEGNPEDRTRRLEEASQKISELCVSTFVQNECRWCGRMARNNG